MRLYYCYNNFVTKQLVEEETALRHLNELEICDKDNIYFYHNSKKIKMTELIDFMYILTNHASNLGKFSPWFKIKEG